MYSELKKLFNGYVSENGQTDSDEILRLEASMWEFIESVGISKERELDFDNLLRELTTAYEEQGFIAGFKQASAIWKEC